MADPIRPGFPPATPQAQRPDSARSAAQRAFFAAASGSAPQAAQASADPAPQPTARPQKIPTSLPADPPQKILRPGSLLDIRV